MRHILKERSTGGGILVDKALEDLNASAGDIVEIHTIDGSVIHKILIKGVCETCSQYGLDSYTSNGCFTTKIGDIMACPTIDLDLVFKDLDMVLENL